MTYGFGVTVRSMIDSGLSEGEKIRIFLLTSAESIGFRMSNIRDCPSSSGSADYLWIVGKNTPKIAFLNENEILSMRAYLYIDNDSEVKASTRVRVNVAPAELSIKSLSEVRVFNVDKDLSTTFKFNGSCNKLVYLAGKSIKRQISEKNSETVLQEEPCTKDLEGEVDCGEFDEPESSKF